MKKLNVALTFILFFITVVPPNINAEAPPFMEVHFIDVGQGDSILVETPNDKTILIDGGLPKAGNKVVSYLKKQKIEKIDLLIATHPDYDHIGGLIHVMKSFEVKQILDTGKIHLTRAFAKYAAEIRKQGIPKKVAKPNQRIQLDSDLTIQVLNAYQKDQSNNESSIVLKMTYNEMDFLFMGDATIKQEKKLMEKYDIQSEIMKVAHHGSDTSTSLEFLREVNPQIAILTFSVDNDYGHPVERVVENLDRIEANVYSTASFGDIIIRTNGKNFFVFPSRDPTDNLLRYSV
ncbi:MBL fold metallo-hydrolase [Oceanobacillus caeni]|uniref:ComEC/Rec2 family competence protein n=1 Tax=Oceanobacillus caeni TaxID=405946 RepID=UPI000699BED5|nr:MBL fold metallo-hydrolase [Oceanobacillus caeni]PZD85006.1 MBL fold metallo-hydrolase [Bacilli bacterium]MCR1835965.1 MBL fold metallo-hydrolase [Oceanobacillus caeni]PZD85861.1 MBL fold metallo-hydrolase [Bacilli bacterium]PZD89438.1 MBL fold metallo-hydrolase [Bacilli bacterium]RCO06033.1 MBL fold metallo-hydrolase [Bacilli bacterium]